MLTISDKAHEMLLHYSAQAEEGEEMALRVEIVGRGAKGFQYDLQFVGAEESKNDDFEIEIRGFQVRIASVSSTWKGLHWISRDPNGREVPASTILTPCGWMNYQRK